MKNNILILSYYANMPGACQAEWIDDRLYAFKEKGYSITIISSLGTFKYSDKAILHRRVPGLSPHGYIQEFNEIKKRKIEYPFTKQLLINLYYYFAYFISFFLNILKLRSGEGRWSWAISSFIAGILSYKKYDFIYSTGGPASTHLSGIFLSKLFDIKLITELQDPLSGENIGRNKISKFGLSVIEKFIIYFSNYTLYCTKNAMNFAKSKYPNKSHKIFYVYPGSSITNRVFEVEGNGKINITYLGSLYQSRNLDSLMNAMRTLANEYKGFEDNFEINLYGNMDSDIKGRILNFEYDIIKIHGLIPREAAIEKSHICNVLLLIQNTDNRSNSTIPFKTYDYLHTGKIILGLLYRNDELENLLIDHGHLVCQADDVEAIKNKLLYIVSHYKNGNLETDRVIQSIFTPQYAVQKMIEIIYGSR